MRSFPDPGAREKDAGRQPTIVDLDPLHPEMNRPVQQFTHEAGRGAGDDWDAPIRRIHRRRLRPELVAFAVAAVIVGTALMGQLTAPPPAPTQAPVVLVPPPTPQEPEIGLPIASRDPLAWYHQLWQAVDWSALTVPDVHPSWGIATASISLSPRVTGPASVQAPEIRWLSMTAFGREATVMFPQGGRVFAFALTWPENVIVTDLSIEYVGSPGLIPYNSSGGIRPFVPIQPLSATVVVPNPTFAGPPGVRHLPPIMPSVGIRSGQFWVPPTQASPLNSEQSAALDWHSLPWPWPPGEYRVQIETARGALAMLLTLRETT